MAASDGTICWRDVARKYFAPEKQSIVVVGDKAAVGEQLKAFGEFAVSDK